MRGWVGVVIIFLLGAAACIYFLITAIQEEGGLL
jgi:hypothetical protein